MTGIASTPYPNDPHPKIKRVRRYWQKRHPAPDALPRLTDIDLMDLHDIAVNLLLGDVIRGDDGAARSGL